MKKSNKVTIIIILAVIIFAVFALSYKSLFKHSQGTTEEIARCIGENSVVYVQLGCHACEAQEELFGDSYQYLNVVDCFFDLDKCQGISATPTWVIKGEEYKGVQSIESLQELTGC